MRYTLAIVGAKFRPPAAGLLAVLSSGSALIIHREPQNAYDENAIMVLVARSTLAAIAHETLNKAVEGYGSSFDELMESEFWHLGYIPRQDALLLAPRMDRASLVELPARLAFSPSGQAQVQLEFEGD